MSEKTWDELTSPDNDFAQYKDCLLCIIQGKEYIPVDSSKPLKEVLPAIKSSEYIFHVVEAHNIQVI
ncbi:hypothetical protein GGI08_007342 [Coemansia sp. S2]|nr:hypothetical protein GGI08_007342 [Coemansia sp. S2]KAJ2071646.1 hypothetical protein GGH13_003222 [Coemansia sp. S155-1]